MGYTITKELKVNRNECSKRVDRLLTVFFIWAEGKLSGSVNGKCLTGAKRKEFKELIREIVFTLFCSSNPRWKTPPGEGGFVGLTLFQKWQGLFFSHLIRK